MKCNLERHVNYCSSDTNCTGARKPAEWPREAPGSLLLIKHDETADNYEMPHECIYITCKILCDMYAYWLCKDAI